MFPKFPKTFSKASNVLWQVFLLSPPGQPKGKNLLFWGTSMVSFFWVMGQSNWFIAKITRQRTNLGGTHLINANHNGPDDKQTNNLP